MAVDPNTGQSVIGIPGFDARYAQFVDPAAMGQLTSQQGALDQRSQLAQSMMHAGYIPNSGFGGALAQGLQAFLGMKMLNDSRDKMAAVNQQILQATQQAAQRAHDQARQDKSFDTNEAIRQASGIGDAAEQTKLKYAPQETANSVAEAVAKAQGLLPTEAEKIKLETQGKIQAATAAAEVANRRGYVVADASGNQHVITPAGKEIYTAASPGGGKLTAPQTALNEADVNSLKNYTTRIAAAQQLGSNLTNWTANYLGVDPASLQGKSPTDLANMVKNAPAAQVAKNIIPGMNGGLTAISNDVAINAAGTKRPDPTDSIIEAEKNNTVSPYKTPTVNAQIILNHGRDIDNLMKETQSLRDRISSRQPPQAGAVPAAVPGPQNPAPDAPPVTPGVTHVWTPDQGLVPVQNQQASQ